MSTLSLDEHPARKIALICVGLVALSAFIGTSARTVLSPLQELIRVDLAVSDNQIALLQGLAIALPLTLLSFPLGRMIDRGNRCRLLLALSVMCAFGSVITAFAHSFYTMFAARMIVGAASTGMTMAAISIVSDLSKPSSRGRLVMVVALAQVFGGATSFALAGPLLEWLPSVTTGWSTLSAIAPWRLVQLAFAASAALVALLLLFLREPQRHELGNAAGANTGAAVRELWGYRRVLTPLLVGLATINMADAAADIWAVPVLTRSLHQQPADFGGWMGLLVLFSGSFGGLMGGVLSDYGQKIAGRGGILFGAFLGAALSIVGALYPLTSSVASFGALFALFSVSGACSAIASTAAVAVLVPNELRGVCISIMAAVSMMVSYGAAPLLVSLTAGAMGLGSDITIPLTLVGVSTSTIGAIAFLVSIKAARRATFPHIAARPLEAITTASAL